MTDLIRFEDLPSITNYDGSYTDKRIYNQYVNISLLQWVIICHSASMLKELLEYNQMLKSDEEFNAMLNYVSTGYYKISALYIAIYKRSNNDIEKVKLLIDAGANVNLDDVPLINNDEFWGELEFDDIDAILTLLIDAKINLNLEKIYKNGHIFPILYHLRNLPSNKIEYYFNKLIKGGLDINAIDSKTNKPVYQLGEFIKDIDDDTTSLVAINTYIVINLLVDNGIISYSDEDKNNIKFQPVLHYITLKQLTLENEQLKKDNALLQAQVAYQPEGPGFYEAQDDFNLHASSS